MIEVKEITNDQVAFYIGGVSSCASCQIRKEEIKRLEVMMPEINFYEINANEAKSLLLEQKISKIPFFMISCNNQIQEIFYTYPSLGALYMKLLKLVRS
jgi:hypothetical protein